MVSANIIMIAKKSNIAMNLAVEIGHVAIFIHVVMVFGHVLMDTMKRIAATRYVLPKLSHACPLIITQYRA